MISPSGPPDPAGTPESLDSAILRLLMENLPDRVYFKDLNSRFVRVNAAHARWLGAASPEAVVGRDDFDFFSPDHARRAKEGEEAIIRTGIPIVGRVEPITKRDGSKAWGSTSKLPWRDSSGKIIGTFGLTRDVTAARQAEEKLAAEHLLLQTIIDHLPSRIFVKDDQGRYITNNAAHLRWLGLQRQDEAVGHTTQEMFPGPRGDQAHEDDQRVLAGESVVLNQEKSDFGPSGATRWSLTTKVPLHNLEGKITGLVGISHDITERKRAEQQMRLHAAELEADLAMARQIQESFFPRSYPVFPRGAAPARSALQFDHRYVPAATLGGDFFDIVQLSDTRCGVLVCDVMGHGVRAGLLTALIRGTVEELGERANDPSHVMGEINRCLMPIIEKTGQPVFASAFYGVVDTAAATLAYANAGHPAPLIVRCGSGQVDRLVPADPEPAAGLVEGFSFSRLEAPFGRGDCLFGYTDGLLEARSADGQMFGEDRLVASVAAAVRQGNVLDAIVREVEGFTGRRDFEDDLCLVSVRREMSQP